MRKNYVKPSLLSETFVTENIMNDKISTTNLWSISGEQFEGIKFNSTGGNTLFRVKFDEFLK